MGDPLTSLAFALIVGYIILTVSFAFSMSFQIGLLLGAIGFVFFEMFKFIFPFLKMGMNFIKFIRAMFMFMIFYFIFMIIYGIIKRQMSKTKDKRSLN